MAESELWVPRETKFFEGDRLKDIIDSYSLYLEVRHPEHLIRFLRLKDVNRAGAVAEAVVFSWLRFDRLQPLVSEDPSKGGPDFMCRGRQGYFLVEATALRRPREATEGRCPSTTRRGLRRRRGLHRRHPRHRGIGLHIVRFSGDSLRYGVLAQSVEGVPVRVFNPAKTLADCFKYRNKIGLDVAIEALRECRRKRRQPWMNCGKPQRSAASPG